MSEEEAKPPPDPVLDSSGGGRGKSKMDRVEWFSIVGAVLVSLLMTLSVVCHRS